VELGARCLAELAGGEGLSSAMRCRLVCRAWAVWGETLVTTCPALSLHWRTPERFPYAWCGCAPVLYHGPGVAAARARTRGEGRGARRGATALREPRPAQTRDCLPQRRPLAGNAFPRPHAGVVHASETRRAGPGRAAGRAAAAPARAG